MPKILLIVEHYYPSNNIGAVRPTKLSKYLTALGYTVDVVTKNPVTNQPDTPLFSTLYALNGQETAQTKKAETPAGSKRRNKGPLYEKFFSVYWILKTILNAHAAVRRFDRLLTEGLGANRYDAVISSFGPLSSLLCGMHYKKKYPHVKWICDFRDPVVVDVVPKLFHPYYRFLQNSACRKADSIITVSDGYLQRICGQKFRHKAYMIPNGYDPDDGTMTTSAAPNQKLTFAYVGSLYSGMRDLSPLFEAIAELGREGAISKDRISVKYAGTDSVHLFEQASRFGLTDIVEDHGQLDRESCLRFQFDADLLILATWNDRREIGVFPGKFLEYMLMEKPIVSLVTGNLAGSEVKKVMDEGTFGMTYEEATRNESFALLKDYIKRQYDSFTATGTVNFAPNQNTLDRYNWCNLVSAVDQIIRE